LEWALEVAERVAILGGMTRTARTRLVRERQCNQPTTTAPTEEDTDE
jgi:hypothetical protein